MGSYAWDAHSIVSKMIYGRVNHNDQIIYINGGEGIMVVAMGFKPI